MVQIIVIIIGVLASFVYVGYLAYAIGAVPLWVIVIGTFVVMIREFVIEIRDEYQRR